jgi:hypothetical protein
LHGVRMRLAVSFDVGVKYIHVVLLGINVHECAEACGYNQCTGRYGKFQTRCRPSGSPIAAVSCRATDVVYGKFL